MQRLESPAEPVPAIVDSAPGTAVSPGDAGRLQRLELAEANDVAQREARTSELRRRFETFAIRYVVLHTSLCVGVVGLLIYLERLLPESGNLASELTGMAPRELRAVAFPTLTLVLSVVCAGLFVLNMVRLGRMKQELTDITGSEDALGS